MEGTAMKAHVVKPVAEADMGVGDTTNGATQRMQAIGLFLRHVLNDTTANTMATATLPHQVASAMDRMVSSGLAPGDGILDELLRRVPDLSQRFVECCSQEELCVLVGTLHSQITGPTQEGLVRHLAPLALPAALPDRLFIDDQAIAATSDVVAKPTDTTVGNHSMYKQLHDEILTAAATRGLLIHGDDSTLSHALVLAELTAKHHSRHAARLLLTALHTTTTSATLPLMCIQALHEMAATGVCVPLEIVEQLQCSVSYQSTLASCFAALPESQVHQLLVEISHAATASRQPNVLALWSALGMAAQATDRSMPSRSDEIQEIDIDMQEGEAAVGLVQEDASQWACALQRVITSTSLVGVVVSATLHDQVAEMANNGPAVHGPALHELTLHWDRILQAMPLEMIPIALTQLQDLATKNTSGQDNAWQLLVDKTQRAVTEMVHAAAWISDDHGSNGSMAVGFYDTEKRTARAISRVLDDKQRHAKKMEGHSHIGKDRKALDAAYTQAELHGADANQSCFRRAWVKIKRKLPSLSKLEIMRDFSQTISLVFTNLYTAALMTSKGGTIERRLTKMQVFYRGLFNVFAADFTAMFLNHVGGGELPDVLFGCLAVVLAIAGVCLLGLSIAVKRGLDPRWQPLLTSDEKEEKRQRSKHKRKIRLVTFVLTICQSVHLPAARLCVEILFGLKDTSSIRLRYETKPVWKYLRVVAYSLLPLYVFGLLFLLIVLIHKNAPKVVPATVATATPKQGWWKTQWSLLFWRSKDLAIHDVDGKLVPFHNSVYAHVIDHSSAQLLCPYRSLYGSFEWRWRYYKVIQLVIKVLLTVSLIPVRDAKLRAFLTLLWTSLSFLMTFSAPFIDDFDDRMEQSAKCTAAVTCGGGVFLAYKPTSDNWVAVVALVINFVNLANALFLGSLTLFGTEGLMARIKKHSGILTFSDTTRYAINKPPGKVLPQWNVALEVRHRVWHAFWKKHLLQLNQQAAIQRLARAVEEEQAEAVEAQRHHHHHGDESTHAVVTQRHHWMGHADESTAAMRAITRELLQGPDVYYESPQDGTTGDKRAGGFGRLTVVAYPFHCEFQYDDDDSDGASEPAVVRIVTERELSALFYANFQCAVTRKRLVRQKLRALSAWGGTIELPYEQKEQRWIEEEAEPTDNASAVPALFHCKYTHGVVVVVEEGTATRPRFSVSIHYQDGVGSVVSCESSEVLHSVTNHHYHVTGDDALALLGIEPRTFDECNGTFRNVLSQPKVVEATVEARALALPPSAADLQPAASASSLVVAKPTAGDHVLSHGFRYVVYNNPQISRLALEKFLAQEETNPQLAAFATRHHAALDVLYERLNYIHSDPRVAFWFLFWHDVYDQNGHEISQLAAYRHQLDPEEPTSICYDLMPRDALRRWLKKRGLWSQRKWCATAPSRIRLRNTLFHHELLDLLYKWMENQVQVVSPPARAAGAGSGEGSPVGEGASCVGGGSCNPRGTHGPCVGCWAY